MNSLFTSLTHRTEPCMYIGKVAEITGATRKAIRHYESIGLIPPPLRKGKYRLYSELDAFLIHMVKQAQSVGFSLKEIKELVGARAQQSVFPLAFANEVFDRKQATVRNEIRSLKELDRRLDTLRQEMNRIFGSKQQHSA